MFYSPVSKLRLKSKATGFGNREEAAIVRTGPICDHCPDEWAGAQSLEIVLGIEEFGPLYKLKRGSLYWRDSID